jgi:hypothetical protein
MSRYAWCLMVRERGTGEKIWSLYSTRREAEEQEGIESALGHNTEIFRAEKHGQNEPTPAATQPPGLHPDVRRRLVEIEAACERLTRQVGVADATAILMRELTIPRGVEER